MVRIGFRAVTSPTPPNKNVRVFYICILIFSTFMLNSKIEWALFEPSFESKSALQDVLFNFGISLIPVILALLYGTKTNINDLLYKNSLLIYGVIFIVSTVLFWGGWGVLDWMSKEEAVLILVDKSSHMAQPFDSERTNYDVALEVISGIINSNYNFQEKNTWVGIQSLGGGQGSLCDVLGPFYSEMGDNITTNNLVLPMLALQPGGNTANAAGIDFAADTLLESRQLVRREKLLMAFIGSNTPSQSCRIQDNIDLVGRLREQFVEENVSVFLCAFTFFDDEAYEALSAELDSMNIFCRKNISDQEDIQIAIDIAVDVLLLLEQKDEIPDNVQELTLVPQPEVITSPNINPTPEIPQATATPFVSAVVRENSVNLRGGPGTDYVRIGGVKAGDILPILARNGDAMWYQVEYAGNSAWISASTINEIERVADIPVVLTLPANDVYNTFAALQSPIEIDTATLPYRQNMLLRDNLSHRYIITSERPVTFRFVIRIEDNTSSCGVIFRLNHIPEQSPSILFERIQPEQNINWNITLDVGSYSLTVDTISSDAQGCRDEVPYTLELQLLNPVQ
jgi:hypothetical protein